VPWLTPCALAGPPADKQLIILRDGRKLIGMLRSFDQFANLVLEGAYERIIVGDQYGDIELGLFVIRGENVVLLGRLVCTLSSLSLASLSLSLNHTLSGSPTPLPPSPFPSPHPSLSLGPCQAPSLPCCGPRPPSSRATDPAAMVVCAQDEAEELPSTLRRVSPAEIKQVRTAAPCPGASEDSTRRGLYPLSYTTKRISSHSLPTRRLT
jgi:U6 snRNA-associated Sm-like protein LSm1